MMDLKAEVEKIKSFRRKVSEDLYQAELEIYQRTIDYLTTPPGLAMYRRSLELRKLHLSILETISLFNTYIENEKSSS